MNGNTPYAGLPGVVEAGRRAVVDQPELSAEQRRHLQRRVSAIADRTREFLPDEYVVDADVSAGLGGPELSVAVHPPVGRPVSAGLALDLDALDEELDADARDEVARGLAAGAALEVKSAIGGNVTPTGR